MGATPLTLRCPRCKKYRQWDHTRDGYDNLSSKNLVATGRHKIVKRTAAAVLEVYSVEVKHDGLCAPHLGAKHCGYVFWTTHPQAVQQVFPKAKARGNATVSNMGPN